ncbi:MAG: type IV toxin-antitoxin system AbiEi family antitoxin domain-containing protein [Actinobacteria bacterium]|nr:type IV toxin-antitoxin system AbiEi family antitoxin domain-containing protein [Actinomycetota bacterium]
MDMKKTILSEKELYLLESLISDYGYIVTSRQIEAKLGISQQASRNLVGKMVRNGWLIRIKRGYFAIANLESHSFSNISPLAIAQVLVADSYVSFEYALNYHGHFDQLPAKVTSVTTSNTKRYEFQNTEYLFVKAKFEMMKGFKEITIEGQSARVADLEKALLDFLHFRRDGYTVDLLVEKFQEAKNEIDVAKITDLAKTYPITLRRRLGFLFGLAGIESEGLHKNLKGTPGFAKLTKKSNIFNAKWRLYYEDRFTK